MGNSLNRKTYCLECGAYIGDHGYVSMVCDKCMIHNVLPMPQKESVVKVAMTNDSKDAADDNCKPK